MRSEDRKLLPGDISRKKDKLEKTLGQLENLTEGTRKYHRKMFKAEKTLDQIQTGRSGIRPSKSPFRLPHMSNSALPVKKYGEAKEPEINRNFPQLENKVPEGEGRYDAAVKQTVSSSGGNDLDEFLKRIESRKIKNPEYADVEGPEYSKSYDFFITNRSSESDKIARQMDSLNKAVMEQAKNRQFDEMRKTRAYQQDLMSKYNLD